MNFPTNQTPNGQTAQSPEAPKTASYDALTKALDAVALVAQGAVSDREKELMQKSMTGAASPAERAELQKLWDGRSLTAQVSGAVTPTEPMSKAMGLDAGGFLQGLHAGVSDGLLHVAESIEKSMGQSQAQANAFAQGLIDMGNVVLGIAKRQEELFKSVAAFHKQTEEKLEKAMSQPARDPKGVTTPQGWASVAQGQGQGQGQNQAQAVPQGGAQPLEKSMFGGQPADPNAPRMLTKGEVLETITAMNYAALTKGYRPQRSGFTSEQLTTAASEYEETMGGLTPELREDILAFRKNPVA